MTIGDNIRFIRKKNKMTQQQLADQTKVNVATIRAYESGKYEPKLATIVKLSKALKCEPSDIIADSLPSDYSFDEFVEVSEGIYAPPDCPPEVLEKLQKIGDSISSFDSRYERILEKINDGKNIDASDLNFLCTDCIQKYYQSLNADGQKQANKMISDLLNNLKLLQQIPEYKTGKSSGNDTPNGTK